MINIFLREEKHLVKTTGKINICRTVFILLYFILFPLERNQNVQIIIYLQNKQTEKKT